MTHKILDHDMQKIIYRSAVRPKKSSTPNDRLAPHGGEVSASSDPSEDKISSGSPLGSPEGYPPKQKAPTFFIRSRDDNRKCSKRTLSRLLAVALRMYLTLHLLLIEQSM